jgi:HSP20 family molecular chaperone IbpA
MRRAGDHAEGGRMHPATIEVMHEQVRAIYRALTGAELCEESMLGATEEGTPAESDVERRFAELEALARQNKALGARVPPFSFTPLIDVIETGNDLLVEIAVPGVEREDVEVTVGERELIVRGVRRGERVSNDRTYVHAEIPRGPFNRTVHLPYPVDARFQLDLRGGVILVRLHRS